MVSILILLPLLLILVLNLPLGKVSKRSAFWVAVLFFLFQIFLAVYQLPNLLVRRIEVMDSFLKITSSLDYLSLIMLFCIGLVCLSSLIVARHTIEDEDRRFNFINLLIICSMGMSGVILVKDLFSLYVFLEITSIATFILISFDKEISGLESAFKYLILSAVATVLMLASIAYLFLLTGDTSFSAVHTMLASSGHRTICLVSLGLFICGLFIKGGVVPFHGWLPDAYSKAPASVSVLLAGIVTKVTGIYTLIRVVSAVFDFSGPVKNILLFAGTLSIIIGAIATFGQKDFKRLLAYSSISQVGYIILGFGTATELGLIGAVFHLFNHAMFKSLLFVNSASVEKETGTQEMEKLGGLSARMPVTGTTSVIGLLSTSGIPPLSGFWSKLIIILALWQAHYHVYAFIAILFSVVTLAYLLYMQRKVFFGKLGSGLEQIKERDLGISLISIILALINVGVGILFPFLLNRYFMPIKELLTR